ncbi:hypothetical protein [Hymenobacter coalescens]
MTRLQFSTVGFAYQPPAGDPLRWRMEDVRVYAYQHCPAGSPPLYALWCVGAPTYVLSAAADVRDTQSVFVRLPMGDLSRLHLAIAAYFAV